MNLKPLQFWALSFVKKHTHLNIKVNSYSQFLLFVSLLFHKATVNTELVNTEPLLLGSCESLITFSASDQNIT